MSVPARRWTRSLALLLIVIAAGLASRRFPYLLPLVIRKRTGDALWASAAFAGIGLVRPVWSTRRVALVALVVAFADEFSQAYHTSWLDHIRAHPLGHLFLGEGFHWLDLVAYVVGVVAMLPVDFALRPRAGPRPNVRADDVSSESACVR